MIGGGHPFYVKFWVKLTVLMGARRQVQGGARAPPGF